MEEAWRPRQDVGGTRPFENLQLLIGRPRFNVEYHRDLTPMPSSAIQTPTWLRQMESILEELNEGVIIVDDQLRMVFANDALIRLGCYEPGEIQGRTPDAIFPREDDETSSPDETDNPRRRN